ncbi:Methyltransferase type 11 [Methylobacterium nodulans ORS 2060]|uniref:Methyltransferase type 11 n=2 Tax=Methylobacterium nodulans TaxID=114616 RepID=B8IAX3_METNO|nr:Methyltransferase type 11 [Methylobacterium nodulans ORS 2060]
MDQHYVHGYDGVESLRLHDQASTLEDLLHGDTAYPGGSTILEAGCGVGAQTVALARRNPGVKITCVDVSARSLMTAEAHVAAAGLPRPDFRQADLHALPFSEASFDHVFVCFVLEHLARPARALAELRRVVKPNGTITVIEGDHGSTFFHPDDSDARAVIRCQVDLQRAAGGDALIGRRLFPLLAQSGFDAVRVSPRLVYVDASRPNLAEGFVRKTFTAMIAGIRSPATAANLIDGATFDSGIRALLRTSEADGVFCYTFFKAVGRKA